MGARPSDYVIIKLDIAVPDLENKLINQIVNGPRLLAITDEFFFEHHVNVKAM